jgi:hypothetical protein
MSAVRLPRAPCSGCDNFLYGFKGTPSARQAGPGPAEVACRDAEVSPRGSASWSRDNHQSRAGEQGDAPTPGRQHAAPYGRKPTGRGAAAGRLPRTRMQPVPLQRAPGDRTHATDRAALPAPGILSPRNLSWAILVHKSAGPVNDVE